MFRKMTVLAMVLGVLAVFALPTSASANWKHHVTNITESKTIGLTGNWRYQGGLGGIECQVTARVRFDPGTTGVMETFVPHPTDETTNCKGLGGKAPCQIHNLTPQAPHWPFHTSGSTIALTTSDLVYQMTGGFFCLGKRATLTGGTLSLIPNQPNTFSQLEMSGQLQSDTETNAGTVHKETVTISGSLSVESPNANTYSI